MCITDLYDMTLAISPFPTVFSKDLYCKQVKTRGCLGKRYSSIKLQDNQSIQNPDSMR